MKDFYVNFNRGINKVPFGGGLFLIREQVGFIGMRENLNIANCVLYKIVNN